MDYEGRIDIDPLTAPTRIEIETRDMAEAASLIPVHDEETYIAAGNFLVAIKALRRRIDETFDPIIDAAHKSHKAAIAAKKQHTGPVDAAEGIVKRKIADYSLAEEHRRREEEARLQALARAREEEARLAEAVALDQAGESALAESVLAAPVVVAPVVLPPPAKVAGIKMRTTWNFVVAYPALVPREYLTPDLAKLGAVVRALKGQTHIPGVEVYEDRIVAVGGRG